MFKFKFEFCFTYSANVLRAIILGLLRGIFLKKCFLFQVLEYFGVLQNSFLFSNLVFFPYPSFSYIFIKFICWLQLWACLLTTGVVTVESICLVVLKSTNHQFLACLSLFLWKYYELLKLCPHLHASNVRNKIDSKYVPTLNKFIVIAA